MKDVVLYLAVKLGLKKYDSLCLHHHGSSEALRSDRSLEAQGVTPFSRLFCITVNKDEQPYFPQDAIDLSVSSTASSVSAGEENTLLDVPEEMLTRASKRGLLQKVSSTKPGKSSTRLFVLQDADLYCYPEAKAKRAKAILHDAMAAAVASPAGGEEKGALRKVVSKAEKFEFVVSAGDRTMRLQAKTPEEGASWIAAINSVNSQSSANSNKAAAGKGAIFRNKLSAAVKVADGSEIPDIVTKSIEFLDKQSMLKVVGLFRLSGSAPLIKKLSEDIDAGRAVDFSLIADPHTVTGLLKLYFREMEEPLFTWSLYAPMIASCAFGEQYLADRIRYLKQVLELMPPLHRATLAVLMKFLAKVGSYAAFNKMPLHNVATVFAPNILRDKDATLLQTVEASPLVNNTVITILEYHDFLLGDGAFPVKTDYPMRPYAEAHHDYAPAQAGDLSFKAGDVVSVFNRGADGWWYGESNGRYGRFPGSYVSLLDDGECKKVFKKLKIESKIQEMREQSDYNAKQLTQLQSSKATLLQELDSLAKQRDFLLASEFPARMHSVSSSMPQFPLTARLYRESLEKMLVLTDKSTAQLQELLIAINTLNSAANNPKLAKKYKKVLVKLEPMLGPLRAQAQAIIEQKRQTFDVRSDLVKDLKDIDAVVGNAAKK